MTLAPIPRGVGGLYYLLAAVGIYGFLTTFEEAIDHSSESLPGAIGKYRQRMPDRLKNRPACPCARDSVLALTPAQLETRISSSAVLARVSAVATYDPMQLKLMTTPRVIRLLCFMHAAQLARPVTKPWKEVSRVFQKRRSAVVMNSQGGNEM